MADIEKVIKGLEFCTSTTGCTGCPYEDPCHDIEQRILGEAIMRDALKLLKEQQPKWIPVSERLPKKEDIPYDCLVTLEHGVVCEATFLDMDAPYHKWCANTGWLYHVTHWMPMPKPPKDGEQE